VTTPRFEPTINLGHLLTIISILFSVFTSAAVIVSRQSVLEAEQHNLAARVQLVENQYQRKDVTDEFRQSINVQLDEIRQELRQLNEKLK